jgi:hypothetical protein
VTVDHGGQAGEGNKGSGLLHCVDCAVVENRNVESMRFREWNRYTGIPNVDRSRRVLD